VGDESLKKGLLISLSALLVCALAAFGVDSFFVTKRTYNDAIKKLNGRISSLERTVDTMKRQNSMVERKLTNITARKVTLFFANSSDTDLFLAEEVRHINRPGALPRLAMEELLKGPSKKNVLKPSIPPGTRLLSLSISDNIAYADFSGELVKNHWGGSDMEAITVGAIVKTLTQFKEIRAVQILVDGSKKETLAGHMAIDQPLSRAEVEL
jgi:spore germination protein GerM